MLRTQQSNLNLSIGQAVVLGQTVILGLDKAWGAMRRIVDGFIAEEQAWADPRP